MGLITPDDNYYNFDPGFFVDDDPDADEEELATCFFCERPAKGCRCDD